jgi:hypothetical protein
MSDTPTVNKALRLALYNRLSVGPECNHGFKIWDALVTAGLNDGTLWLVGGAARCWNRWGKLDESVKDLDILRAEPTGLVAVQHLGNILSNAGAFGNAAPGSTENRFGGYKVQAYDPAGGGGRLAVDIWSAPLEKYLSECPLAGDGIAIRISDCFTLFTSEFVNHLRDFYIDSRPTVQHSDPDAWAAHKAHVLLNS